MVDLFFLIKYVLLMVKRGPSNYDYVNTWRMGYTLKRIHEVWHFQESEEGVFADYVNTWLKIKTEASGWPAKYKTEEERRRFIEQFEAKEGISLNYDSIKKNPARKQVAKLTGETRKKESNNGLIFERRVRKTVFHAQLQQLRDPEDSDDMGGGHHQGFGRGNS